MSEENINPPRKRSWLRVLGIVFLAIIVIVAFGIGFAMGQFIPKTVRVSGVENIDASTATNADFGQFWEAWGEIEKYYLKSDKVSEQDKVYGAIKGLVGSLGDPYSEFFPPRESKKFEEDIQGNFGGIGAELGIRRGLVVVIAPLKDTPAMKAGLRAGDYILEVNSSSTDGLSLDEVVGWIRGKPGTEVKLLMLREDWDKPKEVDITRGLIEVPTLDYEMKEGKIGYLALHSFNANAPELFYKASVDLARQGMKGMILDLRNNPGGYLEVSVDLAGWFVEKNKVIVSEEGKNIEEREYRSTGSEAFKDLPVVVLINQGSASASEILAGALRDIRGVKLIGEKSFGKGTVQQVVPLINNASLKLTIARWVLPSGHALDGEGLKPDIEVLMSEKDYEEKKDPQLDKALEEIKNIIK